MSDAPIVVVGAGLAGLSCARRLHAADCEVLVLEQAAEIGGRVRTDEVDGFLLDHGFQVLLTAYPECRQQLDYPALGLRPFFAGAAVRLGGRLHTVADPWRAPLAGLLGALAPIGGLGDKLRVARLRRRLLSTSLDELFSRPEQTTLEALAAEGFSAAMVDRFFRPFLGGIFLERELSTSSRMFEFVYKMFSAGDTALPAAGMRAIPRQLADGLPAAAIRTGCRVEEIQSSAVRLASGERIEAAAVVLAGVPPEGSGLLAEMPPVAWCATSCFYFAAPEPPVERPLLVLDGDGGGPVNNLCVPSQVAPSYAPADRALVSATVVHGKGGGESDGAALAAAVRRQLRGWFGAVVDEWRPLRSYRIPRALPRQSPPALATPERPVRLGERLYACGDHRDNASIQGAMVSGRRAAEALLSDLG